MRFGPAYDPRSNSVWSRLRRLFRIFNWISCLSAAWFFTAVDHLSQYALTRRDACSRALPCAVLLWRLLWSNCAVVLLTKA